MYSPVEKVYNLGVLNVVAEWTKASAEMRPTKHSHGVAPVSAGSNPVYV